MFAHAGGEYESVYSAESCNHRADTGSQAMNVNIKRELGPFVAFFNRSKNLPHVARESGNSEQPRLLIQDLIKPLCRNSPLPHEICENAGIDRPGASAHH